MTTSSNPEEIRAEIERTRANLSDDVNALTHEANPRQVKEAERCEITCYVSRTVVRAEAATDDEYSALDLAMSKLTERLRRLHDKRRVSHTGKNRPPSVAEATYGLPTESLPDGDDQTAPPTSEEALDAALETRGNSPIEIREKLHASSPMTVGQALSRMELVGHDFFLFHDVDDSGGPCFVQLCPKTSSGAHRDMRANTTR